MYKRPFLSSQDIDLNMGQGGSFGSPFLSRSFYAASSQHFYDQSSCIGCTHAGVVHILILCWLLNPSGPTIFEKIFNSTVVCYASLTWRRTNTYMRPTSYEKALQITIVVKKFLQLSETQEKRRKELQLHICEHKQASSFLLSCYRETKVSKSMLLIKQSGQLVNVLLYLPMCSLDLCKLCNPLINENSVSYSTTKLLIICPNAKGTDQPHIDGVPMGTWGPLRVPALAIRSVR